MSIQDKIASGNQWFTGSHFEWVDRPSIRRIYQARYSYIVSCIERAKLRLGPNLHMLDAGCGDGYWLTRLMGLEGLSIVGVDYNPLRVERAKIVASNAKVIFSDLSNLSVCDQYDVVLLSQVIEHVTDDMNLLHIMRSILRPGGVMILGTPNEGSRLQQWMLHRTGALAISDHTHFYTEGEIRNKINTSGFIIDSVMREVFYPGYDRVYYYLTERPWGFRMLEWMTQLWPSECSDYYFECQLLAGVEDR